MFKKIALSLLALYGLLGFFVLPLIVKSQIIDIVEQKTNAKLLINDVYFNPFIFNLQISGVKLNANNGEHLVSFKFIQLDLELYSLLKSAIHINNIIVDEPKVSVVYNKDKIFNFSTLLKEAVVEEESLDESTSQEMQMPRVIVDVIKINSGEVDYEDFTNSKKFDFSLHSIGFELKDIDTNDFDSSDAKLRFYSDLDDGGFVDFRSEIVGFQPLKLKGSISFEASKLYTQWRYIQDMIGLEVANGKLSFGANYHLNMDDLNSTTIENLYVSLENLRVKPKNEDQDVLNLKYLHVEGVTVKPMLQDVHVQRIVLNSLDVKVKRDDKGEIDWIDFLKDKREGVAEESVEAEKTDTNSTSTPSAPWNVVLDEIALQKVTLKLDDTSVKPQVSTTLNEFNLRLNDVTLLGEKPFSYSMNLVLNDKFKCNSSGDVIHKNLEVNTYLTCQDFDVIHYKPYIDQIASNELKTYNVALKNATVSFDVNATIKDEDSQINAVVNSANLSLDKFILNRNDTNEKLVGFKSFDIKALSLNTKTKDVAIGKVVLDTLMIDAKKDKNGAINFDGLIEPKESVESSKKSKDVEESEKAYVIKLKHFKLGSAKVSFDDKSLQNPSKTTIDKINLNAYNIDSRSEKWLKYNLSLKVNNKGELRSKGSLSHTPLKQKGTFELDKISLKEFTPYIGESAYLKINDGYLSLNSKVEYSLKEDKPDLEVNGGVKIEKFFLYDSRNDSLLVSFNSTELKSLDLNMFPNSLYINEINLDSFYLDAQIDENKNMNLAKLMKVKSDGNLTKAQDTNTTAKEEEPPFPMKIMKFHVSNGNANFADFSLPVKFKTSIHDLNGNIYAISNNKGEVSYVDIDGEVDKYGSTKLKGSIETSNIKSYTDIDFNFKNLGLNNLSGYSAQFAGYEIEKGKLYLDLGYKIYNSELLGKNSIIIKNIELGDEVEDENITKLPLGFAIALLEDSDGIIDINMPVEGNLDEPDFKYGALVLKTLGNLIIKAVASPFNFLGAMMGLDGDDLKFLEFEAGEFKVLPPQKEKLDNIASILIKKPKLLFAIIGSYNKIEDKKAIQSQKLTNLILQKSANKGAVIANVLENIYLESAGKDVVEALKIKLKKEYKPEMFKVQYQKELSVRCRDIQEVTLDELKDLANKRASMIQEYIVQSKNIDLTRIIIHEVEEVEGSDGIKTALEIEVK